VKPDTIETINPLPQPFTARRRWLRRSAALIAAGATIGAGLGAVLLFKAAAGETDTDAATLTAFMDASHILTGKTVLDRSVGTRLLSALQANMPDFAAKVRQLAAALHGGQPAPGIGAVQAGAQDPQQALASAILRGWYLGLVDRTVATYEQSLMFAAVSNTLPVRSYCGGAPGFWAAPPMEG
jgi:hypothetical protein